MVSSSSSLRDLWDAEGNLATGVGPLLWALLPFQAILPPAPVAEVRSVSSSPRLGVRHRRKLSVSRSLTHHHSFHRSSSSAALSSLRSRRVPRWLAGRNAVFAYLSACLLLTFVSPVASLWWSLSGLLAGTIVALICGDAILDRLTPIRSRALHVKPDALSALGRRGKRTGSLLATAVTALVIVSALRDARTAGGALARPLPHGAGGIAAPTGREENTAAALYGLHPTHSQLMTVLLMTAPRPGHPDFLLETLSTYLASFPDPALNPLAAARLSLVVYTHFANHPVFTQARDEVFKDDAKAKHYVKWIQRVPDQGKDRLDQRLHLARALRLVTQDGGISADARMPAYVMLAEDDFPLCPDHALSASALASPLSMVRSAVGLRRAESSAVSATTKADAHLTYASSWSTISRLILSANAQMPDLASDAAESGHCGVFVGTGGSGLIMRGWLAGRIPGLLLGTDDERGWEKDRQILTADEITKEIPPTDVLIQDCLMGKVPGCEACAPPTASRIRRSDDSFAIDNDIFVRSPVMSTLRQWYLGLAKPSFFPVTARDAYVAPGDRFGKSGLVTSERLLMRHLGYNASTIPGRSYKREEWDCGWRHPFVSVVQSSLPSSRADPRRLDRTATRRS